MDDNKKIEMMEWDIMHFIIDTTSALQYDSDWQALDRMLDPENWIVKDSPVIAISYLRNTWRSQHRLPNWYVARDYAAELARKHGTDPKELLTGLYDEKFAERMKIPGGDKEPECCPSCKSEEILISESEYVYVECNQCDLMGPEVSEHIRHARQIAVGGWNGEWRDHFI